ncbi:MAG: hypothetical protein QME76_05030 [Bacillota bacterium]|nr:hypothetical protein [Bacillota bacterium]
MCGPSNCRDGGHGHARRHGCCCGRGFRRFFTKQERLARLEAYLKDLEAEATAVRQCIEELKRD